MTELQKVVYEVLQQSSVLIQEKVIYASVQAAAPHLCKDVTFPCPYCKQQHPSWQHQIDWALQYLRSKELAYSSKKGFWEVTTKAVLEPTPSPATNEELFRNNLKREMEETGSILAERAKEEYRRPPYV